MPVYTIDAMFADAAIDLIKIDVEGFEIDVLRGAEMTLARCKPLVFVEFNAWTLMAIRNINPREFLDYIGARFPFVYRYGQDGALMQLGTAEERISFLADNVIHHGCVDDLIIGWHAIAH